MSQKLHRLSAKIFLLSGIVMLLVAFGLLGLKTATAQSFYTGNNINTDQDKVINQTVFASGRTLDINSEVFGDVFCAGMTITVSAPIHGDVICAGQNVSINAPIDGDVRLAGQNVTISAPVSGNATVGGQTFTLSSDGKIGGDLTLGSSDANLNGPIGRNVIVGGQNVVIANSVGGEIKGQTENLHLTSSAKVAGNVTYASTNELQRDDGAQVGGQVTRNQPKEKTTTAKRGAVFGFSLVWFLYLFFAMLATSMALVLLFPQHFHRVTDRGMPTPWKALLTGVIANILVGPVLLLLGVTVIGLPLAIFLGLFWLLILFLSGPVFAYYIGRLVLRDHRQPLLIMLVGSAILLGVYFLPILGLLGLVAAVWFGSGMLLLEAFRRTPRPSYNLATANATATKKPTKTTK